MNKFFYIMFVCCCVNIINYSQPLTLIEQASNTFMPLSDISFIDSQTGYIAGQSGKILYTSNAGSSWLDRSFTGVDLFRLNTIHFVNSATGFAAGYGATTGYIIKTTNAGMNWQISTSSSGNDYNSIFFIDNNTGWTCMTNGSISQTTNSGINWYLQSIGSGPLRDIKFSNNTTGWVCSEDGKIYGSTNSGNSWQIQFNAGSTGFLTSLCIQSSTNIYAAGFFLLSFPYTIGPTIILKTTNGGVNWQQTNFPSRNFVGGINFADVNHGYIVGEYGYILYTTDAGSTWTQQNNPLHYFFDDIIFVNSNSGYVVGDYGKIYNVSR